MDNRIINLLTESDVYCNGRMKINPCNGEVLEDVVANRPIFRRLAVEEVGDRKKKTRKQSAAGESAGRSAARARKQLFELAVCNPMEYFITLTLDEREIDRYDYKQCVRRLGQWLSNRVERNGFQYILVPELHKDGALHFHGLVNGGGLRLCESGHKTKDNRTIYNISNWRYGFTTAVKLSGDYGAVCRYITKYITKSTESGCIGGRYFFHGGDLRPPRLVYYQADNWAEIPGKVVVVEDAGLEFRYRPTGEMPT